MLSGQRARRVGDLGGLRISPQPRVEHGADPMQPALIRLLRTLLVRVVREQCAVQHKVTSLPRTDLRALLPERAGHIGTRRGEQLVALRILALLAKDPEHASDAAAHALAPPLVLP